MKSKNLDMYKIIILASAINELNTIDTEIDKLFLEENFNTKRLDIYKKRIVDLVSALKRDYNIVIYWYLSTLHDCSLLYIGFDELDINTYCKYGMFIKTIKNYFNQSE